MLTLGASVSRGVVHTGVLTRAGIGGAIDLTGLVERSVGALAVGRVSISRPIGWRIAVFDVGGRSVPQSRVAEGSVVLVRVEVSRVDGAVCAACVCASVSLSGVGRCITAGVDTRSVDAGQTVAAVGETQTLVGLAMNDERHDRAQGKENEQYGASRGQNALLLEVAPARRRCRSGDPFPGRRR